MTEQPTTEQPPADVEQIARDALARSGWSMALDDAMPVVRATLDALVAAGRLRGEGARLPEVLRGDGPCDDCGTLDNIIWFTESVFWNAIMRPPGYERDGILCIPCFVKRADTAGYAPTGWMLLPQWHWETHREREARRGPVPINEESPDPMPDAVTNLEVADSPKMLRETLCIVQTWMGLSQRTDREGHSKRLQRLIDACDVHRPLGQDGKHGDRHTPTCGCEENTDA